jgi:aryl carrier-like protein
MKEHLRTQLPEFMIPQTLIQIPAIPLTVNGKLDRRALPDGAPSLYRQEAQDDGPRSPAEAQLGSIWVEVLGQSSPGVNANFFRFGGDSLLSIRVVVRLRELGYAIQVQDVFAHPTIRALARVMMAQRRARPCPP